MQRNSPKMLAIRAIESVKLYGPFLFFYLATLRHTEGALGIALDLFFWAFTYSRLHAILFDWWTVRFALTDNAFIFEKGLIVKERLSLAWADMASVQVSEPLVQRVLNCVSVQVGVGAQTKQQVVLDALDRRLAEEMQRRHAATAMPHREQGPPGKVATETDTRQASNVAFPTAADELNDAVIYTARPRDYLLIAATYGQVFLVFPVLLGLYAEGSAWLPLPAADWLVGLFNPPNPWQLTLLLVSALVFAFAYGLAVAWLRYRSFRVERRGDTFYITGGLTIRERRQIEQSDVAGLKLEQNPAMRATGYARLSLVSREAGSKMKANVIFPAVRLDHVMATVADTFPEHGSALREPLRPKGPHRIVIASCCVVAASVWALVAWLRSEDSLLAGIVLGLLLLLGINRLWTAIAVHGDMMIQYKRGFLWVKQYALPASSVHVAAQSQGPVGRQLGLASVSLVVHDARPVRLRVIGYASDSISVVLQSILAAPRPALSGKRKSR